MTNQIKKVPMFVFVCTLVILLFSCASAANLYEIINSQEESIILPQPEKKLIDQSEDERTVSFTLPASLTIVEDGAFEGTAISEINLPGNVTTIGDYAFADISNLKKITIPTSTTFIGDHAFKGSNQVIIISKGVCIP